MHLRKQLYPFKDYSKTNKLDDYGNWRQNKQRNLSTIASLQRENEKLLRQNMLLKDENRQLLMFKEKYLQLNILISRDKQQTGRKQKISYSAGKKYSAGSLEATEPHSARKGIHVNSGRKYECGSDFQIYVSTGPFQSGVELKSETRLSLSKRKRFNYISEAEDIPLKTNGIPIGRIQQTLKQAKNAPPSTLYTPPQSQQSYQTTQPILGFTENNQFPHQNTPQPGLNQQITKMKQQISELKQIQSQLIGRIQQRDDIIEKLRALLTYNPKDRKEGKCESQKNGKKQTREEVAVDGMNNVLAQ